MKELIERRPLISFYVLAYFISWIIWIPLIFIGLDEDLRFVVMLIGVLGPMAAAIVVSTLTGTRREFWKRTLHWRVPVKWYIAAFGIPLVVLFLVLLINYLWGVPSGEGQAIQTIDAVPWFFYPLILLFMIFVGGGLEEPGWRGFAQERMLKHFSPLAASIILGVIWTYWHAPLFFVPGSSQQGLHLGWYTGAIIGLSVTMTWLFIKSKGSALLAIIFHGGINAINSWIPAFSVEVAGLTFSGFVVLEFVNISVAIIIFSANIKLFLKRID